MLRSNFVHEKYVSPLSIGSQVILKPSDISAESDLNKINADGSLIVIVNEGKEPQNHGQASPATTCKNCISM